MRVHRSDFVIVLIAAALAAPAATASSRVRAESAHRVAPPPLLERFERVEAGSAADAALRRLAERLAEPAALRGFFDRRTGRPAILELSLPWLPAAEAGRGDDAALDALAARAAAFLDEHRDLFAVPPAELVLDREASRPALPLEVDGATVYRLWHVIFRWAPHGEPVDEARVVFRINSGNLVQVAVENVGDAARVPRPGQARRVGAAQARRRVEARVGGFGPSRRMLGEPTLRLVATVAAGENGEPRPLTYRRAWMLRFADEDGPESWEAAVDADTGEVLHVRDVNLYGYVLGDVRPAGDMSGEITVGMPYADYGGGNYANSQGSFLLSLDPLVSHLAGARVRMADVCGAISVTGDGSGGIDFGGVAGGGHCNGAGGPNDGNTAAARTAYYWTNYAILVAEGRFPLPWSAADPLDANTNLSGQCLAWYDREDDELNFRRPSIGCRNTAENASHVLHEAGHAIDHNDGTPIGSDLASGEAFGDIVSFLLLGDSCIARDTAYVVALNGNLVPGCGFYVDRYAHQCLACDGFRDLDWRKQQAQQPMTPARSFQLCPAGSVTSSPCGRQPHCEGAAASEAMVDLVEELKAAGMDAGTARGEAIDLFFASRPSAGSMYTCQYAHTTGDGGAASGSLYHTLRAADDCDGNLANGTPHGAAIFAALERHGIAVGAASDAANQNDTTMPAASFTWSCVDSTCTFDGRSSTPANGLVAYTWSIPGAGTKSGAVVSHSFVATGTYSVKLTVRDVCGRTASRTHAVPVTTSAVPMAQVGSFNVNGRDPVTLTLSRTFTNPVVIAQSVSGEAWLPEAVVRITSVTPTSFTARLQSGSSMLNPQTRWETVSFLVVEAGKWRLQGSNALLQAGKVTTSAAVGQRFVDSWATVSFPSAFPSKPVILSQVQTFNDWNFVTTRQTAATASSFRVAMEGFEADLYPHGTETIGWVAITPGSGLWGASNYHANHSYTANDQWSVVHYAAGYCNSSWQGPHFLAGLATFNERHAHLRHQALHYWPYCTVQVRAEEDVTWDAETTHSNEELDFLLVIGAGLRNAHLQQ